ncbi:MAG: imidazolonepropionase [Acidobacteriota bacterium]
MKNADLAIINASELATPSGFKAASGKDTGRLKIIQDAAVAAHEGRIVFVGSMGQFRKECSLTPDAKVIDASGGTIIPGFVDCHTHLPFAGFRDEEFLLRVSGATYEEIARVGGGIWNTVKRTREASLEKLAALSLRRLDRMLLHGTTTCEAKSGYGLTLKDEMKQLEAIRKAARKHPVRVIPTLLGAHTIPGEYKNDRECYVSLIIEKMIPEVVEGRLAEFCDVFCDEHGFSLDESRRIITAAKSFGLKIKVHADQFSSSGGSTLAAEFGAASADHLENISDDDIDKLARSGTVGVLLPGSVYFLLKKSYAPARKMLSAGMALAISTDFNPGSSMTESMLQIIQLSVFMMDISVDEALTMATLNGAAALGRADRIGSLEVGKDADILIMDIPSHIHLAYHFGINHCSDVIIKGKACVENGKRIQ